MRPCHGYDALPDPPPHCQWVTQVEDYGCGKITFSFALHDAAGNELGKGRIAVELYGWSGVRERANRILAELNK